MKIEVKLYVNGSVFIEECYAKNYEDAKLIACNRNPTARVISVTRKF